MTTSSLSEDQLRQQIRVRLAQGRLPVIDGVFNSHRGTNRPCIVFRRATNPAETEREVHGVGAVLTAHEASYILWRE